MSQVYDSEPPTRGKVTLHTTHGDVEVELWAKEAPKAVRNFVQLIMEGYYDGTIFHRVIKGFMVQGGDPSGTGQGGDSIYGKPFKDEFHSRLRFTHRGLVACANASGTPNSNGSQFFITCEASPHLDRQNTIFGRVTHDTIFTVLRIADAEADDADRPLDPPRVVSAEVLWPPFDDIQPRTTPAERRALAEAAADEARRQELLLRKQHGKKLNVLSFGDEAEEDDAAAGADAVRFRSAHETVRGDARLEEVPAGAHDAAVAELRTRVAREREAEARERDATATAAAARLAAAAVAHDADTDTFAADMQQQMQKRAAVAHTRKAAAAPAARDQGPAGSEEEGKAKRPKVAKGRPGRESGREGRDDVQRMPAETKEEKATRALKSLKAFQATVKGSQKAAPHAGDPERGARADGPKALSQAYAGRVNEDIDHRVYMPPAWRIDKYLDESDDEIDGELFRHKLEWNTDDQVADPTRRREDVDDYKVVDPLLEAGRAAFSKQQQRQRKRNVEWAGRPNM